jgi:hypothetical protein
MFLKQVLAKYTIVPKPLPINQLGGMRPPFNLDEDSGALEGDELVDPQKEEEEI